MQINNTTRKNKQWLQSKRQRRTPKVFEGKFVQLSDGSFQMLGGETKVLIRHNQHSASWVNVDTRDFACELRQNKILSL
jgi:hypothetical protein